MTVMVICGTCEFSRPEINYSLNSDGIVYYRTQRECSTTVIHTPPTVPVRVPVHHRRHPPWAITNCFYQLTTSLDFEIGRVMVFHGPLCLILMLLDRRPSPSSSSASLGLITKCSTYNDDDREFIRLSIPPREHFQGGLGEYRGGVGETKLYQITRSLPRS